METAIGLFFFGLCGFFVLKAFIAGFRMDKAGDRLDDYIHKEKKYHYLFEVFWPFSLVTSKDKHIRERRHHLIDMLFYVILTFLTMMAFAFVKSLFE